MAVTDLGRGGVNYATADTATKKKIIQNQASIAKDEDYRQSEIQRALQTIAARQAAGKDTSDQQKYLNVNLGYKAPTPSPEAAKPVIPTPTSPPVPSAGAGNTQSELLELMKGLATREATPFSYDPNSDPAYQAALTRARANMAEGNSAALAEMNRRGILNSTITSDRMGEIASQEMGRVETDVLPSLMQAAYQRYMDQENMKNQQLANVGNVAQMYINEDQRGIDNTNTRAQMTGYLPGGEQAQQLVTQLMGIKQQAEAPGITAAERTKLSNQADGIRALLSQMGVDVSQYGANVNYSTANQVTPSIRTLAGQQLDMARSDQAFNQQMTTEQFAYQKARDAISDKQWQAQFDESVRQHGLGYALQMLSENNQQAYRQASLALQQDDNARAWAQMDYNMSNPGSSEGGYRGLTANQVLQSMQGLYTDPVYAPDGLGGQEKIGSSITKDPAKREQMFLNVVDSGLTDAETNQILNSLGMSKSEIDKYMKKYGASSGN